MRRQGIVKGWGRRKGAIQGAGKGWSPARWWVAGAERAKVGGDAGVESYVGNRDLSRVSQSSGDKDVRADAKRLCDGRARKRFANAVSTWGPWLPEGCSKGQEQVDSFQNAGGVLQVSQPRVKPDVSGKGEPSLPSPGGAARRAGTWRRKSPKISEARAGGGVTVCQE